MIKTRKNLTRNQALDLMVEAKVLLPENKSMVCGSKTEIDFAYGGIDADKNGFFKHSDVCRLIGQAKFWYREH